MSSWLPGDSWWQQWPAPAISILVWWLVSYLRRRSDTRMTSDILEFVHVDHVKDAARNIWINVAVVNALVLTIVIAMLQQDPISVTDDTDTDRADALVLIQGFYISLLLVAFMSNTLSLMKCIVNLTYSEPLSNKDVIKYFIANPNSLGEPVCDVSIACLFMSLALACWVLATYGIPNAILACAITIYITGYSVGYTRGKGLFNPSAEDPRNAWSWALQDVSEWPSWVKSTDPQTVKVFTSLANAARSDRV